MRLYWSADYLLRGLNLIGYLLLYCAVFLYEDQEGQIHNKVAEWWVRVDDAKVISRSWAAAFLQGVSRLALQMFDRVLGEKLASFRFAGVSFCLSASSLFLIASFGAISAHQSPWGALLRFGCCFGFALVPSLDVGFLVNRLWGLALIATIVSPLGHLLFILRRGRSSALASQALAYFVLAVSVSFVCDVTYVAITRWMLRRAAAKGRVQEIVLMVTVNLALLFLVFLGPIMLGAEVFRIWQGGGVAILFSFALNAIDFFAGAAAFLLAAFLLIHRLAWPIIESPLYAFQRYRVVSNKKLLWGAGIALVLLPTHVTFGVLRLVIEKLFGVAGA